MMLTTAMQIVWRPAVSPVGIVLLCVALAALTLAVYVRGYRAAPFTAMTLGMMRLAAIVTIGALLMGPSVVPPRATVHSRPTLHVLLDTSASMLTTDAEGRSRLRYLLDRWLSPSRLQALGDDFDVHLYGFDEASRALSSESLRRSDAEIASGGVSRYIEAVSNVLLSLPRDETGHALLLLGDGHDTQQRPLTALAELAKNRQAAVHSIAVGSSAASRDAAVVALPRQDYLMAGEAGQLLIRLFHVGYEGASARVQISDGRTAIHRDVRFTAEPAVSVEVPVTHLDPGVHVYDVKLDALPGEKVTANNEQKVFIEVAQRRLRVLLLEGEPFWDTKFLAQSLRSDPRVELTQISQVSATRRENIVSRAGQGEKPAVPSKADEWARFDVIIVGRGLENILEPPQAAALVNYVVESGGRLIFARGRPYNVDTVPGRQMAPVLAPVEPVIWGTGLLHDLPLSLTAAGRAAPSFAFNAVGGDATTLVPKLPPLGVIAVTRQLKPATQVLATAGRPAAEGLFSDAPPAIVAMSHGRGRVLAVLGEGLWRWSFLPPELRQYKGVFDTFWSNTVRSLALEGDFMPGEDVALQLSRTSVRTGDPLEFAVAFKYRPEGFAPRLTVRDPEGVVSVLQPGPIPGAAAGDGRLQAQITPEKVGVWSVTLDAPPLSPARIEKQFSVYSVDLERLNTAAVPRALAALSEATGGVFLRADEDADLRRLIQRQFTSQLTPPRPRYVWDNGWLLAGLVAWLSIEWIARRTRGWL